MKVSQKRILVWSILGLVFALSLIMPILYEEIGLNMGQILLGVLLMSLGLFRSRLREWLEIVETDADIRVLLQVSQVLLGLGFAFSGGARFFELSPTLKLIVQLVTFGLAFLFVLAGLVKRAVGGRTSKSEKG